MKLLSRVQLFVGSYQAPPSMEFSRQEYWSTLPFPSPGYLPDPGIEPRSPTLWVDTLLSEPPGKFPCSSVGKLCACSAGDLDSIPGLGRSPGEGNGNPLQYHCLENLMGRGAWWTAVHGVAKSGTTEQLTLKLKSQK